MSEAKQKYHATITLDTPIQWGKDEVIKEINIRKPKAKDLRGLKTDIGFTEILDLTIKICDQPRAVIDDLEIEDTQKLMEVVGGFFENGQKTETNI